MSYHASFFVLEIMPEQRCERDGEQGWRWGETGKCFLPSEEGSDGKSKRKAILQGIAIGELDEMSEITELANILDVPVLTAGKFVSHNAGPLEITEDDLDEIIEGSNRLQPIITDAITTGVYQGNEEFSAKLSKTIPGLLNVKHQIPFESDTFSKPVNDFVKDAVSQVTTSFRKAAINGKNWIVQQFEHVPEDIARTLAEEFPYRSVELLPLTDPDSGRFFDKIIRSTAFLDRFTTPAVPGQNPELIVEFAGTSPLITITTHQSLKGDPIMAEKTQDLSNVVELQELHATLDKQNAVIAELNSRVDTVEEARQAAVELAITNEKVKDEKIAELQGKQDEVETQRILSELSGKVRKFGDRAYLLSPAFMEIVTPSIKTSGVIELAEGENLRQKYADMFDSVIELAGKNAILVPIETQGPRAFEAPDSTPKTEDENVRDLMAKNPELTKQEAFVQTLNAHYGGN